MGEDKQRGARGRAADGAARGEVRADVPEVELALDRADALGDVKQETERTLAVAAAEARRLRADAMERAAALTAVSKRDAERRQREAEQRSVALGEAAAARAVQIIERAGREADLVRRAAVTQAKAREDRHRERIADAQASIDQVLDDGDELALQIAELRLRVDRDGRALEDLLRTSAHRLQARLDESVSAVVDPGAEDHVPSRGPGRIYRAGPPEPVEYVTATIDLDEPVRRGRPAGSTTIRARRSDLALGPRVARRVASFTRRGRAANAPVSSTASQRLLSEGPKTDPADSSARQT